MIINTKFERKVCGAVMKCIVDFNKEKPFSLPNVLEIGCAEAHGVMRYAGFCNKVIGIDDFSDDTKDKISVLSFDNEVSYEHEENEHEVGTRKINEADSVRNLFDNFEFVIGYSLWPTVVEDVKSALEGELIDILVIDGTHHPFEAVYADFKTYYHLLSDNAFIIFDDVYEDDVFEAFNKAKDEYKLKVSLMWKHCDFNNTRQQIGVLRKCKESV